MNEIQRSISSVINGLTIYLVTNISMVVIGIVLTISLVFAGIASGLAASSFDNIDNLSSLASLNILALFSGMMVWLILILIAMVVSIYGMYKAYAGLKSLAPQLDSAGALAVKNLSIAMLIMMITSLCTFIPILGGLVAIGGSIAAIVLNIMGYSALRSSTSLNEEGKVAAKKLFNAMIIYIVMIGCILIPIIGWLAIPVLYIIYWVKLFSGWKMLRDSFSTCNTQIDNQ